MLAALVRKSEKIKEELGSMNTVLDAQLMKTMQRGIHRDTVATMEKEISATNLDDAHKQSIETELEVTRQRQQALREQIDRLRTLLESSKESIGLDEQHFRSAISSSLELLGAEPLKPLANEPDQSGPPRMTFPGIDQREGADPTWADTIDTLRVRRKPDQKLWQWRNEAPIRPVVFEDSGRLDDEVVHLHLEHRVVQRLLGRFNAQGFVHHDLSRACFAQTTDAIPRVVLLGRLSLYGPGAVRLHEELIPITARWADPQVRKGSLSPYAREAETKTLALLDEAFIARTGKPVAQEILKQLQSAAPHDIEQLLPHLQTRGQEYARDAEKKLLERGAAEATAMREILETQKKHIAATAAKLDKCDTRQLKIDFGEQEDERRQLESNRKYWTKRLLALDQELRSEPTRIQDLYSVKATRIEPVGLVYLWPVTG